MDLYEKTGAILLEQEEWKALRAYLNLAEERLIGYCCYTTLKKIMQILEGKNDTESNCIAKVKEITGTIETMGWLKRPTVGDERV